MVQKKQVEIVKGVGIGMAIGGALGMGLSAMKVPQYQRTAKKGLNRAMKVVNNVVDAIS
ncbi:MAG: hypothetical protein LBG83_08505 [Oscillospiraceae bacterium]|jgi:hypothetical protein|nr:hypothetical protein [Oscillospiraceae bacterium]